jgi:hypothetical protein
MIPYAVHGLLLATFLPAALALTTGKTTQNAFLEVEVLSSSLPYFSLSGEYNVMLLAHSDLLL